MDRTPQEIGEEFESLLGLHCANVARASIAATAERLKKGRSEECEASYSALMQAFTSLTARLSAAERDYGLLRDLASDLERRAEAAEAKLAEAQKDAARYRWLRLPDSGVPISHEAARNPEVYDAAIDQAMKEGATK